MTFFERTTEEIVSKSLDKLSRYTNITQLTPGGKTRALLDIVSEEQGIQHSIFDENLMQPFVRYADDRFLGFFGDMKNLPRIESSFSSSLETDNFLFYVSSGTFGDINSGSDIIIPAGQIVSTVPVDSAVITPGLQDQQVITYVTTSIITCSSASSIAYGSIKATIEGASFNVPRNVLNKHTFSAYALSSSSLLKCTNKYSISNGENRESDQSYRYRLSNINKARQGELPISVRLAALSVRGVADIKEVPCEQGCGSYSIYVRATTPTPSPALLREVSNACASVTNPGIRVFVLAPEPIGVELVCGINWSSNATKDNIQIGYQIMRNLLEDKLNKTKIGEEVTLSDLVDLILSGSQFANSIGINSPNKFESTYLYRRDPVTDGVVRNLMSGDKITPLYNERVILETSTKSRGIQFLTRQQ